MLDTEDEKQVITFCLDMLRYLKNRRKPGSDIRNNYNSACDKLDILLSKINQENEPTNSDIRST